MTMMNIFVSTVNSPVPCCVLMLGLFSNSGLLLNLFLFIVYTIYSFFPTTIVVIFMLMQKLGAASNVVLQQASSIRHRAVAYNEWFHCCCLKQTLFRTQSIQSTIQKASPFPHFGSMKISSVHGISSCRSLCQCRFGCRCWVGVYFQGGPQVQVDVASFYLPNEQKLANTCTNPRKTTHKN